MPWTKETAPRKGRPKGIRNKDTRSAQYVARMVFEAWDTWDCNRRLGALIKEDFATYFRGVVKLLPKDILVTIFADVQHQHVADATLRDLAASARDAPAELPAMLVGRLRDVPLPPRNGNGRHRLPVGVPSVVDSG